MINQIVLMSGADYFSNFQAINPYYHEESIDIERAVEEHGMIKQAFERAGIKVLQVDPPRDSQDGVYTANWALTRDKKAVLSNLPEARRAEKETAKNALIELGFDVHELPKGLRFSGQGDALPFGDRLLCGMGYRSDEQAQEMAADILGYDRVQLRTIPELDDSGNPVVNTVSGWEDSFFYDIDLALSIIREPADGENGLIAYCPGAFEPESRDILKNLSGTDKIEVSFKEAVEGFACNLVSTGETVVMSGHAPQLKADLEERGLKVITPEIRELVKGGGFIRCVSLTLD